MMARVDKQKLQREKQLFAYSSALQQGDFDTVARILQAAEHDPLLADMLAEINVVYERELPSLTPMVNHSSNHYEEKLNMTASVTVVPHRPLASSRPRLSITLLAAMLAVSLLGGIMLFMRPNTSPNIQAGAAPTASPSVTVTATLIPTASPVGANDGVVNHQIVTINTGSPDIRLTVRAEPSLSAHIVTTLPDGHIAALVAYSDDGQWARIILSDGSTGWVIRDMLSPDPNLFVPTIIPAPTIIGVVPIDPSSPLAQLTPANPVLCEGVIGNVPAFVFSRPSTSGVVVDTIQYSEVLQIGDEEYNPVTNVSWYYVGHGWVMAEAFTVLNNCPPVNLAAVSVDQADVETTQQAQLTGVPFVPTVPPPPSLIPTPTAYLNSRIGDGQFSAITLRPVGEIPSGTLVQITSAYYTGEEWIYQIVTINGAFANARESELTFARQIYDQLVAPASPTFVPTATWTFTPTPAASCSAIYRGGNGLPVYTRPDSSATSIGRLPEQTSLNVAREVHASDGTLWYLVTATLEVESQITGWVHADEITVSSGCRLP